MPNEILNRQYPAKTNKSGEVWSHHTYSDEYKRDWNKVRHHGKYTPIRIYWK